MSLNFNSENSIEFKINKILYTCVRKGTTSPILESELQPLFEKRVKISDFQTFIDSNRKVSGAGSASEEK